MPDRLTNLDFARHNAEVKEMWAAFHRREPTRTPVIIGLATRFFMFDPDANPRRVDFLTYTESPRVMFDLQLQFQRWQRHNVLQDAELGLPEKWGIGVDLQNYYEAAWFGCPVQYLDDQVPDSIPAFEEAPERVMEKGLPDPFGGVYARALDYYEQFKVRAQRETYLDRAIEIGIPWAGIGSDGPFTVACNLFGPTVTCELLAAEPARFQVLMEFITTATVRRLTAWRKFGNIPVPQDGFGIADDSLALISTAMYREHVLPHHRRLYQTFGTGKPGGMHLCGDATRHFRTMRDELNIGTFDTGFPVDFAALRRELGPDIQLQGGPHIEFLRTATPAAVRAEVKRIMESGVRTGGRFVLREGNNLAPGTPLTNTEALYQAGREFGAL